MAGKRVAVTRSSELEEGRARVFQVAGTRVAVCKVGSELYAIEDVCSHDDGPLGEGRLDGHEIECPRHGARFDVRDGKVARMPAAFPVRTYPVHEENGEVYVEIE